MRERDLEKKFVEKVKAYGGVTRKWSSQSHRGVPDRVVIWPGGDVHFVELKTETGVLSALQKKEINLLDAMKASVFVLYGIDDVNKYMLDNRWRTT